MKEMMVAMEDIAVKSNRQYGGDGDIRILAEDMKANGQINAINLKRIEIGIGDGDTAKSYEIVAGRRRFAAAQMLGWAEIRSNVFEAGEEGKADAISGSENINRLAMHPLDEAEIFRRLIGAGESVESLAKKYDRTKAAIWQRVQLLGLGDGIKELFRQGKISLHAAAMLKSLDAGKQEKFCDYFKKTPFQSQTWAKTGMPDSAVQAFIAQTNGDKLYKCVAGAECQSCQKRTFFSDKELFPELGIDTGDACLDHECYMEKWKKLLAHRIKGVEGEHKGHAGAVIITTDSGEFKKIFGKTVTLDGTGYTVKKIDYSFPRGKESGAQPCFEVELSGGKLKVVPRYWKEPEQKQAQAEEKGSAAGKAFAPVVKLLGLPKEEAARTVAALGKGCKEQYQADHKMSRLKDELEKKLFARVLETKAKRPDDNKDIDRFLADWLERDEDHETYARVFAGEASVKALRKLSWPKLFAVLRSEDAYFSFFIPGIDKIAAIKKNELAEWAGIPMEQFKEMYREELRALMPKPDAAPKAAKKPAAGKPAKKKAGVRTCRVCGCTENTPCIDEGGDSCSWVEKDLCSACVGEEKPAKKKTAAAKAKKPAAKKQPARAAKKTANTLSAALVSEHMDVRQLGKGVVEQLTARRGGKTAAIAARGEHVIQPATRRSAKAAGGDPSMEM